MSKKIVGIQSLGVIIFILTMLGCSKTTTVVIDNSPAVTGIVSFSKTIVPIITKSCAGSGCHSGSIAPNLSEATAYNAMVNGNYINKGAPAESEIYLWITGKRTPAMPLGSANNPSNLNALMLAWIKQGAKNN